MYISIQNEKNFKEFQSSVWAIILFTLPIKLPIILSEIEKENLLNLESYKFPKLSDFPSDDNSRY